MRTVIKIALGLAGFVAGFVVSGSAVLLLIYLSTAATNCARWRRESVPVWLKEKGREALASCVAARGGDLCFGDGASFAGRFECRARRLASSALCLLAGRETKTLAIHLQNVDMVREAIEERAGEPFRSED